MFIDKVYALTPLRESCQAVERNPSKNEPSSEKIKINTYPSLPSPITPRQQATPPSTFPLHTSHLHPCIHLITTTQFPPAPPHASCLRATVQPNLLAAVPLPPLPPSLPSSLEPLLPSPLPIPIIRLLQQLHRNPSANASYSISVHASPYKSASKSSHTGCEGSTSRSPVDCRRGAG